jgi:hypothetical protein
VKTSKIPKLQIIFSTLKKFGLLLESDQKFPSVSGLIAGEPIRGSWWSHPKGQEIFKVLQQVADHKDVLIAKLLSGKVTFVHRKLWCEALVIGQAREPWQLSKLSAAALALLRQVDSQGSLQTNSMEWPTEFKSTKPGDAVRELEKHLLVETEQFHTPTGDHAKRIQTWKRWAEQRDLKCKSVSLEDAKRNLEKRVANLNEQFSASAKLPW